LDIVFGFVYPFFASPVIMRFSLYPCCAKSLATYPS
jgi:hypothetical protein